MDSARFNKQASSATPVPHADNVTHENSSRTIFVLSFDATKWSHPHVPSQLLDLAYERISGMTGVLGAFDSVNKAQRVGKAWIMRTLLDAQDLYHLPLPIEMDYESLPGEWKRTSWVGDESFDYTVSDNARQIYLSATITTVKIDEEIDNESYATVEEDEEEGEAEGSIEHTESEEEAEEESEQVESDEGMDNED